MVSPDPEFRIQVVRSARRQRTSSARLIEPGVIEVRVPARLSRVDTARVTDELVARLARQLRADDRATDSELLRRAIELARRHGLEAPATASWSTRQKSRFGSCTPDRGAIRLSARLRKVPGYVIDAVLIHELAHLSHADHGPLFWELAQRAPKLERADGFLEAMALHCDGTAAATSEGTASESPLIERQRVVVRADSSKVRDLLAQLHGDERAERVGPRSWLVRGVDLELGVAEATQPALATAPLSVSWAEGEVGSDSSVVEVTAADGDSGACPACGVGAAAPEPPPGVGVEGRSSLGAGSHREADTRLL